VIYDDQNPSESRKTNDNAVSSHFLRRRIRPTKSSAMKIESPLNDRVQSRNFLWVEIDDRSSRKHYTETVKYKIANFIDRMNSIN